MAKRFVGKRSDFSLVKSILVPLFVFIGIIALFNFGLNGLNDKTEYEQLESTKQAVRNATVQCYSLEGQYPPSVQYLKDYYGLQVDTDRYIVDYRRNEIGNMMPEITVLPKYFTVDDLPPADDPLADEFGEFPAGDEALPDGVDALPPELAGLGVA